MRFLPVLLLAAGCATKALWSHPPIEDRLSERGRVVCEVVSVARTPAADRTVARLAFEPKRPPRGLPRRLAEDVRKGRTWLELSVPTGISCAAYSLLAGRRPFTATHATVRFGQCELRNHRVLKELALLRIEGRTDPAALAASCVRIGDPGLEVETLGSIEDPALRSLIGHGLQGQMALLAAEESGWRELDSVEFAGVVDETGRPVAWREALLEACAAESLAGLEPLSLVARHWRVGRGASWFRVPFPQILLLSQMRIDGSAFVWEGLWYATMARPHAEVVAPAVPMRLEYVEYREDAPFGAGEIAWRLLLTPVALAADYAACSLVDVLEPCEESPGQ